MATLRLMSARLVTAVAAPNRTGTTTTKSLEAQARDGQVAVNNYRASVAKWLSDANAARRIAISNVPQLHYLAPAAWKMHGDARFVAALRARAGQRLGDMMLAQCQTTTTDGLSDNTIATVAAAYDDYFAQPGGTRFNPQPGDASRKYSFAWERLNQGTLTSGQPDPAHPESTPLADVISAYGLRGLYWYRKAVPAVTLIAVLKRAAPDWSETPNWLRQLEPLTYFNVTSGDLEAAAGEVAFSNPIVALGNLRGLAAVITGQTRASAAAAAAAQAAAEAGASGPDGAGALQDGGGLPWGTIIVLLLIAGAVYWFVAVRKG